MSNYKVREQIGEGGMGSVYRALQVRLDREVALKILKEDSPHAKARFRREIEVVMALCHPGIVRLYDYGEIKGQMYIAMELLQARPLVAIIREKGRLPIPVVLSITAQVASALAYCHEHSTVHRDLKPHNIMVDDSGKATLMDFGLSRLEGATILTRAGDMPGTPQFLAPEVVAGRDVSPAADIFALGATVYEMITGHRAFPEAENLSKLLSMLLKDHPPAIRTLRRECPEKLAALVSAMLAKRPEQRPSAPHIRESVKEMLGVEGSLENSALLTSLSDLEISVHGGGAAPHTPPPAGESRSRPSLARFPARTIAPAMAITGALAALLLHSSLVPPRGPVHRDPPAPATCNLSRSTPSPAGPGQAQVLERLDSINRTLDHFGEVVRIVRPRDSEIFAEFRHVGNEDEVRPILLKAIGELKELVRECDQAGFSGPTWLDMESVLFRVVKCVDKGDGFRRPGVLQAQALSMKDLGAGDFRDPFRRCVSLSVGPLLESTMEDSFQNNRTYARALLEINALVEHADPFFSLSLPGFCHRARILAEAATRFDRTGVGRVAESVMDTAPESRAPRIKLLDLHDQMKRVELDSKDRSYGEVLWLVFSHAANLANSESAGESVHRRALATGEEIYARVDVETGSNLLVNHAIHCLVGFRSRSLRLRYAFRAFDPGAEIQRLQEVLKARGGTGAPDPLSSSSRPDHPSMRPVVGR